MTNFVIAISGASGAGKTTLIRKVVHMLDDAVALHFDDYQPVATYPTDMAQWIAEGKDLNAWVIPQLHDDLKILRNGKPIILSTGQEVKSARFIVLEEPSGRARTGLRELIDFVVLLDLPLDVAFARKVVEYFSYCTEKVPTSELAQAVQVGVDYFAKYPVHREYYLTVTERVREDCDLVLDGTRPTDELAQRIVNAVKSVYRQNV